MIRRLGTITSLILPCSTLACLSNKHKDVATLVVFANEVILEASTFFISQANYLPSVITM
jgi:hypothetical protein